MSNEFPLEVMSSIERKMRDIRTAILGAHPSLKVLDIDDSANLEDFQSGVDPALLWQLSSLDPRPVDPLYQGSFLAGAKTTTDPGNYLLTELVSDVLEAFPIGSQLKVSAGKP